jgi:hypothetical protein
VGEGRGIKKGERKVVVFVAEVCFSLGNSSSSEESERPIVEKVEIFAVCPSVQN